MPTYMVVCRDFVDEHDSFEVAIKAALMEDAVVLSYCKEIDTQTFRDNGLNPWMVIECCRYFI